MRLLIRLSVVCLALLYAAGNLCAQTGAKLAIRGVVVDTQEPPQPVIGATVYIKDTQTGTVVDVAGSFSIDARKGDVLVFSCIGYKDVEYTVTEKEQPYFELTGKVNDTGTITQDGVEATFTNKRTVKLSPSAGAKSYTGYVAQQDFTDYVISTPVNHLESIQIGAKRNLLLSHVVIDSAKTKDDDHKLILNDVDTRGLDLVVKAREIIVKGKIQADDIRMTAVDGTNENEAKLDTGSLGTTFKTAASAAADQINISDSASITVEKNAELYSAHNIALLAQVKQDGAMIRLLPNMNLVNVKVADAKVDVAGKLYAGYDEKNQKIGKGERHRRL